MPYSTWGDNNRDQEYGGCPRRISEVIFAEMFGYKPKTNWTTFGGIQKIAMGGDADDGVRMYVLDGQGQVWVCGHGNNGAQGRNWTNHTSQQRRMYPSSNSQGDGGTNRGTDIGACIDNTDHDDGVSSRNRMFLSHNNTWTNGYYVLLSPILLVTERKVSITATEITLLILLVMVLVVDCIVSTVAI